MTQIRMKPTILFLFNSSDYAVRPWLDDGRFNVVSIDYDDTDQSEAHKRPQGDHHRFNLDLSHADDITVMIIEVMLEKIGFAMPSLVISFAPCTDLAVAGAKHFLGKLEADPDCQNRAVRMAKLATQFDCPYMVENPVSILATLWRKPNLYWHPWQFSYVFDRLEGPTIEGLHPEFPEVIPPYDWYNKKSCLWTGGGFIHPLMDHREGGPKEIFPGWAKLGGKSARTKYIRSLTPRGFAYAVYAANYAAIL